MRRNLGLLCAVAVLLPGLTSCQKIEDPTIPAQGPLQVEMNAAGDAIPLDYGEFVGSTTNPATPWQTVLWFEDADQTLTAVWVNTGKRRVVASLKIPRR